MSNFKNIWIVFLATLSLCSGAYAELTLQSSSIFVESNANVFGDFPFPGAPRDRQGELVENFPGAYDKVFTAGSAIDGAENVATTRANITLSTATEGVITASGTTSASTNYTKGGSTRSEGAVSDGTILFDFSWTSDGEVLYRFERTLTRSATGIGRSGAFGCDGISCPPSEPLVFEQVVPAGTHRFAFNDGVQINGETGADASAEFSAVWSITITELAACELTWADPAGGDFSDAENWSPSEAPVDSGDGCVNLVLDETGAYGITLGSDAAANSLTVSAGEPSLLGGTLTLGGVEFPDSLSVVNAARLTVESGTVQSDSVLVSGAGAGKGEAQPAFLRLKPGTGLNVTTALELGRGIGEAGELTLGDGAEQTTLTILGDATLGGAGRSTVFANGNLNMGVFGDLTLGLFLGSQSNLNMNGDASLFRAAQLGVEGTLNIGAEGAGALSFTGLVVGTVDALRAGVFEGGEGTLNLSKADCQLDVTGAAAIGIDGRADVTLSEGARLNAASMVVGSGELIDDPSLVTVTGELSQLAVSGDIDAGAGLAGLVVAEGAKLTAANLTVDGSTPGGLGTLSISGSSITLAPQVEVAETLTVGGVGDGSWGMSGSGTVTAKNLAIGVLADGNGLATFSGDPLSAGIEARLPTIKVAEVAQIGLDGRGTLESTGSSDYEFGQLWLGVGPTGEASYTSSGGFAFTTVTGQLLLGVQGKGSMTITSGGVLAGACALGAGTGGLGELRLFEGAAMTLNPVEVPTEGEGSPEGGAKEDVAAPGFLEVGRQSNGLIELFDDVTRLRCDEAILGGDNAGAGGTISIDTGAGLDCAGSLTMGAGAGPALLRIANGAELKVGSLLIVGAKGLLIAGYGANSSASFVSVEGRLNVIPEVLIERPQLKGTKVPAPKGGTGPAVIDGGLQLGAGGVLSVTAGASTALQVTGAATLNGTLEIVLPEGLGLINGQLLSLIAFNGGVSGAFTSITFVNAPEGFTADIEVNGGQLGMRILSGGLTPEGEGAVDGEGSMEGQIEGEGQGGVDGEAEGGAAHTADQDADNIISLSELLRVIQLYNAARLGCDAGGEDGFAPGGNNEVCAPHASDYEPQDWRISLSELLRLIQLYNTGAYIACTGGEDGYCPGA